MFVTWLSLSFATFFSLSMAVSQPEKTPVLEVKRDFKDRYRTKFISVHDHKHTNSTLSLLPSSYGYTQQCWLYDRNPEGCRTEIGCQFDYQLKLRCNPIPPTSYCRLYDFYPTECEQKEDCSYDNSLSLCQASGKENDLQMCWLHDRQLQKCIIKSNGDNRICEYDYQKERCNPSK